MSDIERCVSCGDVITDDGCACPAMTAPGALTREQVEEAIEGGDAEMFLKHDAALRQALAQQAQEVERVKLELATIKDERALVARTRCRKCGESSDVTIEYGRPLDSRDTEIAKLRQCWKEELRKRCSVQAEREELKQQLAAMTTERDEWKDQWRKTNDEFVRTAIKLSQQNGELAASQARCRELEALVGTIRGCLDIQPIRNVRDIGVEEHSREIIGQLQATLAAREAEIVELETRRNETISMCEQLRSERDAAVQELTRLNERLIPNSVSGSFDFSVLPIERCLTDTEKKIMQETQEVLNDQHASGSSGGSANSGMGE